MAWAVSPVGVCADNPATHVLVVANKRVAESVQVARYYASRRGVPNNRICLIDCPQTEAVSRKEYVEQIENPIRSFLESGGLLHRLPVVTPGDAGSARAGLVTTSNKIRYIVLCHGVPLKIAPEPSLAEPETTARFPEQFRRNEAAVDSELALLPSRFHKVGFVLNPLYNRPDSTFREPMNNHVMLVTRLDGPNAGYAKALVDRAIEGERLGLIGRAYFDARGIKSGGYLVGDEWIRKAYELTAKHGFESVLDDEAEIFDIGYPMTDCVLYAGWYTGSVAGAIARKDFRFRTGAFAYHLHSDSAGTIRSETTCWVGPLVARGAACTMGCVYEPYLQGSPNLAIFFDRFLQGHNFAESAYASQQMLSWQTTFVGDPLYRPFAVGLDQQLDNASRAGYSTAALAHLRAVNLLLNQQKTDAALRHARELDEQLDSSILVEKIADILAGEKDLTEAIRLYKTAAGQTTDDWQAIRLHYKLADVYRKLGKDELALQSYEAILQNWPGYEGKIGLYLKLIPLAYKVGPQVKADAWKADALRLNPALSNQPSFK